MADEIYGAFRVTDLPETMVDSVERSCTNCDADVWIDRNMIDFAESVTILCMQCMGEALEDEDDAQLLIHPLQATAILGYQRRN